MSTRSVAASPPTQSCPSALPSTSARMPASVPVSELTQPKRCGKLFKYPDFSSNARLITGGKRRISVSGDRCRVIRVVSPPMTSSNAPVLPWTPLAAVGCRIDDVIASSLSVEI